MKIITEQSKRKLNECLTGWHEGKLSIYNIACYAGVRWNTAKKYLETLDKENINMNDTIKTEIENSTADLQPENRQQPPSFLLQAKDYIKQHPEAIRQVAGEEISRLEDYLDTLPLGIGEIGKQKLNEFLGGAGKQPDSNQSPQVEAGDTNTGVQIQEDDEHISKETWSEILEYMIELDQQGFTPGRIRDDILHDYGVELHPLKIKKQIEEYYRKVDLQPETEIIDAESKDIDSDTEENNKSDNTKRALLSVMRKLQAENNKYKIAEQRTATIQRDLKSKQNIQDAVESAIRKHQPPVSEPQTKPGIVRRFLKWLI